jgi:hypothetical protein
MPHVYVSHTAPPHSRQRIGRPKSAPRLHRAVHPRSHSPVIGGRGPSECARRNEPHRRGASQCGLFFPTGPTGPRTPKGKAVSARNATTHGLFCRQTVLPHLGEDADGYKKVLDTLSQQFDPRTLMERQYLELWAEASWKLRRLSRWEAQLWEQEDLDEDDRLGKLERVMRLQTTLRRQLDKAVRMLSRDVPEVQQHYARRAVLATRSLTEADCREDAGLAYDIEEAVQGEILNAPNLRVQGEAWLDTPVKPEADTPSSPDAPKNCQNELSPASSSCEAGPTAAASPSPACGRGVPEGRGEGLPRPLADTENCQNEPPNAHHLPVLPHREDPREAGRWVPSGGHPCPKGGVRAPSSHGSTATARSISSSVL